MKLSKIKIAGFKSFVDPTEVVMPSNLIGVVGPNGCGKSNIIDAVRWVMGETSAKMLRGASMTDVIFSGSSSRKPVSMATVELIFDNTDGLIKGEFAKYNEISVKRQVNRDAQSAYFLNGNKCRKKDIVDLFLGTGLGPRSYSIIEQGMISNIVESKPEELRGYIEEAAGVSKYRERRRETERRIKRTKENLERLDDLRSEVGKHIQHLQRQAKNAEKYTQLKDQFKQIKAEVLALRWQQWQAQAAESNLAVARLNTAVEQAKSGQTDGEKNLEAHRAEQQKLTDENNRLQENLYQTNAEIGKIEQAIAHAKSLSERHQKDLLNTEANLKQVQQQQASDEQQLADQQKLMAQAKPELESLSLQLEQAQEMSQSAEETQQSWRQSWDENNEKVSAHTRVIEVEKTRITALESHLMRQSERLQSVKPADNDELVAKLDAELQTLKQQLDTQQAKHDEHEVKLAERKEAVNLNTEKRQQLRQQVDEVQEALHQAKGRRGSLLALQQAAQSQDHAKLKQWVKDNPKLQTERLADLLDVDAGWENAVETVLQDRLQAWVTSHADLAEVTADWAFGAMTAVHAGQGQIKAEPGTLAECVKGPDAVIEWFNQIKVCDTVGNAQKLSSQLSAGESIITRNGEWFGQHWIHIERGEQAEGFLLRQKELKKLTAAIEANETRLTALQEELAALKAAQSELSVNVEQLQLDVNMSHRKLSELSGLIQNKEQLIVREQQQNQEKAAESTQIKAQMAEDDAQVKQSRSALEAAMNELAKFEAVKAELMEQQQSDQQQFHQIKAQLNDVSNRYYQHKMGLSATQNKIDSLQMSLQRSQQAKEQLVQRKDELMQLLSEDMNPIDGQKDTLDQLIAKRVEAEKARDAMRQQVTASQSKTEELERLRHQHQQQIDEARNALETAKLASQSHELRANGFAEQLQDMGQDAEQLLKDMDSVEAEQLEAVIEQKEERTERLQRHIVRLEPVNLAAIEEFDEESKRKKYLDDQNEDLENALETLEGAIARIDKDTRTLFKETFEAVNSNIKQLFPRLFGGGHAYLELTGNDLLTTGVSIMARPPGKRVSSIQLLSGGEKALTAVSLVFAIFNLNPAPFCMLDEVDAPLDDANVTRFSDMVAEMSEKVQFLFVSHNKVTMEIAHQLMGVTMREPGVSRLVSVDLSEAAKLAAE